MSKSEFYAAVRKDLGSLTQSQVDGFEVLLDATISLPLDHRAYVLATAWHETAETMQPVRETRASTDAKAISILETAWKAGKLPWVKTAYWRYDATGKSWLGRGYVQLTHRYNYETASEKLGIDLLSDPGRAMVPDIAAKIAVRGMSEGWFTGKKMSDYSSVTDMRRVVNGTDRAAEIARYAEIFKVALINMGNAPFVPVTVSPVGFAAIIAAIVRMFGKVK